MTNYTAIWGGAAGDALRTFYWEGQYAALEELGPDDTCDIFLPNLNPYVHEWFKWHPAKDKLNVVQLPYIVPDEDEQKRKEYGIPLEDDYTPLPRSAKPVVFYPSPEDEYLLGEIGHCREQGRSSMFGGHKAPGMPPTPLVIFSPIAGTPDRDLPETVVKLLSDAVIEAGGWPIQVGRSFDRQGRAEKKLPVRTSVVDALSLPGVCKLVQGAAGVVCCHSMVSMLCFLEKIPQLLLYPEEVRERHFRSPDMWSWGAESGYCVHGVWDDFDVDPHAYINSFLAALKAGGK